jgi:regulator of sigma E protease
MNSIFWLLEVVLAFSFMIAIHEYGHFMVCRLFGVEVDEFAIGFGPTLASRKWGKTLYSLRTLPLGGFCKPKGGDLSGETAEKMYEKPAEPGEFLYAAWWKRVFIFLAGPGMNFISAFVICFLFFWIVGDKAPMEKPYLGFVPPHSAAHEAGLQKGDHLLKVDGEPYLNLYRADEAILEKLDKNPNQGVVLTLERNGKNFESTLKGDLKNPDFNLGIGESLSTILGDVPFSSPARKAGLMAGDVVLSVNGQKVSEWAELTYIIHSSTTDEIKLLVSRGGKTYPVSVTKVYNGMGKFIGISPPEEREFDPKKMSMTEAFTAASNKITNIVLLNGRGLWEMITGKVSLKDNIGGPVTIMRFMYQSATMGLAQFVNIVAYISLILCIMNLLPIPVVDGGQIVLCLIEGIKRKAVPVKIQMVYQQLGFIFVVGLMLFAVAMDFWNLYLEKFHNQIH